MDSFSIAPRLRVPRNHHLYSDRSQVASTIEGPSRFPEQTQLMDMDMTGVAGSETTEQSRPPSSPTPPAPAGRTPTPADNLRALMLRLESQPDTSSTPRPPVPSLSPAVRQDDISDRESDFLSDMEMTDPAEPPPIRPTTPAQKSLQALFSNARSDEGFSSRKDHSSRSPSERSATGASVIANTTGLKGKQPSFLADENSNVNPNESIPRAPRRRSIAPPLTKEFLRERFSESRIEPEPPSPKHNSSNETATILRDLSDMNSGAPQATSTPMQSLRMSFSGQYQSNLLDQDTEMQRAIDDQDSNSSNSLQLPPSSPTVRKRPLSRQGTPSSPDFVDTSKTPTANTYRAAVEAEKRMRMRSGSLSGKDRSYTPSQPSSPNWEQTPRARRPSDDHPSDFESDDGNDGEDNAVPSSNQEPYEDEYSQPGTSYRSQNHASNASSIPRPATIPYISINGHRSVSLSRARSGSVSSVDSQKDRLDDDELPESEPEQTSSRLSYAYSTPRSTYPSHPTTVRRIKDVTRSLEPSRVEDEEEENRSGNAQRSTTPIDSPGHGLSPRSGSHSPSIDRSSERAQTSVRRSTTPNDSPRYSQQYQEPPKSRSPLSNELHPSSMNRSSSLQNIDNTYHIDASERNMSRGSPSTSGPARKSSSSSFLSATSSPNRSSKTSSSSTSSSRSRRQSEVQETWQDAEGEREESTEASPQPTLPRMKSGTAPPRFMSASPPWSPVDEEQSHLQRRVAKRASAELNKKADLPRETTRTGGMAQASPYDDDDPYQTPPQTQPRPSSRQQEKRPEFSPPRSVGGHHLLDDRTPPSFHDVSLTPPRNSSTPKNAAAAAAREPKSPSSSVVLPDLPTPSSSDESETEREAQSMAQRQHQQRHLMTPKPASNNQYQNGYEASWMPTPKPPGGWLQTPMPAPRRVQADERHPHAPPLGDSDYADESEVDLRQHLDTAQETDAEGGQANDPKTPLRQGPQQEEYEYVPPGTTAKTPRFPGAWRTPGPATPAPPKRSASPPSPPPPVAGSSSLHPFLGQAQDQRHQGLLTPVNSLSRASQQDPKTPYVTGGWVNTPAPAARKSILKVRFTPKEEEESGDGVPDKSSAAPPTPHRSIRVLDAFGREQVSEDGLKSEQEESRAEDDTEAGEGSSAGPSRPMSRADVLQDIRRKINTLVEDIEEIDSETKSRDDERIRIEELNAISRQARDRRAQLESDSAKALTKSRFRLPTLDIFSTRVGLRFYFTLFLLQVFLVLLMYRLSVVRARHIFLNSYYDPYHPDLHVYVLKYDNIASHLDCDTSAGADCRQTHLGHSLHTNLLRFLGYLHSHIPSLWNGAGQQSPGWWPS